MNDKVAVGDYNGWTERQGATNKGFYYNLQQSIERRCVWNSAGNCCIGIEEAYKAGLTRAAEIADNMAMRATEYADNIVAGKHPMQIPDYTERNGYRRVAAAIRKEIRGEI